ncbi:response regulator [Nitrogeniibacter mangrovi]|uniref:Virulence sensor protein BvgS n=1 Tax=Nitrogeniibacter mangrovi TaxID=2016596 RepID=A0A6C1B0M9_9RHOO|nr:response regulator [Nitrogeniibacter mangrovi]QID16378.1 response regulator [Nitrogeniibacter mangrovi]
MNSPEPKRRRVRMRWPAGVAVTPLFLALMICLAGFVAYYWFAVLAPRLDANARANATALASSQATSLADALLGADPEAARRRLAAVMDEILIAREPTTGEPIFLGLKTEIDYDTIAAPVGLLDLDKRSGDCGDCLAIDVPLYTRTTHELIGIARFDANLLFVEELKQDVRDKLSIGAALLLVVIGGIWWVVVNLLRKIARSERHLRAVFEAAPVPMMLVRRRDDRILRANEAAAHLFAVPVGTLPGRAGSDFHVVRQGRVPLSGPHAGLERVDGREVEIEDHDGRRHWVLASSHPIGYFDEPAHILSYADVTALKRVQHELLEAKEAAEAATRAKSLFVANMSHEIRTPLNAVTGYCHLAERTRLDSRQRGYLASIRKATDLLMGIINNILDFSKLDAGKMALDVEDFGVRALADDLLDLFGVLAEQRGLRLEAHVDAAVPETLAGDAPRLKQVLTNLVGNALKFTERGGVRLDIRCVSPAEQAPVLRFEVTDTGIGIAPEVVDGLFQSFTQADSSITRKHGGTGLGLAISRSLVTLMDGEIGVDSTPGQGSTFWFTATLARARGDAAPAAAAPPPQPRAGARVLVVDDNRVNRSLMIELLDGLGLQVVTAENGVEAVETVERMAIDLVLMDLQMPHMDGYEATARIRARHEAAALPIVAMTAHGRDEDRVQCLAAGMNAHLGKPIDPDALAAVLGRWLPVRSAAAGAAATGGTELLLPGVNVSAGLARAGYKDDLYRRLLREFAQDHAGSARRLREAIEAGDRAGAARVAHNLKGTAANLGARELESRLQTFERVHRDGADPAAALAAVEAALSELTAAIAALAPSPVTVPADFDAARVPACIEALAQALREGNFAATERLERLAQALGGRCQPELNTLTRAVQAFDFDAALRALEALSAAVRTLSEEASDG